MAATYRHISAEHREGVTILMLTNFELLDRLMTNELQDELLAYVEADKPRLLVISFAQVKRCSTETINAVLRCRKHTLEYGGELKLCGMSKEIRDVYRLLRLDGTVFEIYDTVTDAWSAF